jgi:hypothetical protein
MSHQKVNDLSALHAVNNQIEFLLRASSSPNGYFDVMDCGGRTTEEIVEEISDHQRWMVQQKISILTLALTVAKKKMNWYQDFRKERKKWLACFLGSIICLHS